MAETSYDLLLLDVVLPDGSGLDLLQTFRRDGFKGSIIMLSGACGGNDRARALRDGADDFVEKPFSHDELSERCRIQLRILRAHQTSMFCHIRLNRGQRALTIHGSRMRLTRLEFDLVEALICARGVVLSRNDLLRDVWGITALLRTRTLDAHIKKLRSKLTEVGVAESIRTVNKVGFAWVGPHVDVE